MSGWGWAGVIVLWCVISVPVAVLAARHLKRLALLAEMRAEQICVEEGCEYAATHERFEGATTDGIPIVSLTCPGHARDGRPREELR